MFFSTVFLAKPNQTNIVSLFQTLTKRLLWLNLIRPKTQRCHSVKLKTFLRFARTDGADIYSAILVCYFALSLFYLKHILCKKWMWIFSCHSCLHEINPDHISVHAKALRPWGQSGGRPIELRLTCKNRHFGKIETCFHKRPDLRLLVVVHCLSNHKDSLLCGNAKLRLARVVQQATQSHRRVCCNHTVAPMVWRAL